MDCEEDAVEGDGAAGDARGGAPRREGGRDESFAIPSAYITDYGNRFFCKKAPLPRNAFHGSLVGTPASN